MFNYYANKIPGDLGNSKAGALLDRFDVLSKNAIKEEDIEFLRSVYLPEKQKLKILTGNQLACWDYGEALLRKLR